ncbi:MAG: hypothetical protein EOS52_32920 [Mesorhizobium sp.]|uniref:NACHT domain-containing protein n=1 Tax=Mesorhizobium sp. TaxID=1871066 RepID=UPI000FE6AFF1|nr:restriction endonuclease [Mesorhizobium sp.]RWC07550.1 MAG: hypothetical protein EOS52_32920 [Mesorhizobium sp.]
MASTIQKGNAFRDHVASILEAAGFYSESEIRVNHKKVDVRWIREDIDGLVRYGVEAKDYAKTLSLEECREFVTDYGALLDSRLIDKAWLVSRGDVSPDGRALIDARPGLKCLTYAELQRRLMGLDGYLRELVQTFENDRIADWIIPPHTESEELLEAVVYDWIDEAEAPPLAIVSGYGKGKSTFARYLAAKLASEALLDFARRLPILVPLGDIVDEQSLEGLLGKVFTSKPGVRGYNFGLFQNLNRAGRFVVIFDGFDEMKHGMTLPVFENMIVELMRLDKGDAKIIILGRDTAFQDDIEFRSIISGRQVTSGGVEVQARDRRAFREVNLREFTLDEARRYVENFFPIAAHETLKGIPKGEREKWLKSRIDELTNGNLDFLLLRPVHAQMLCHIATERELALDLLLSKHGLFERFVHFLIDREVRKKGRDDRFSLAARRKFNSDLALWLWLQGGISTMSLANIPIDLCKAAAHGVTHDFDDAALRKELTAGCLIEKQGGTIYFGHRSLQEFLVADAIVQNSKKVSFSTKEMGGYLEYLNPEVSDFLLNAAANSRESAKALGRWIDLLAGWHSVGLHKIAMRFLLALSRDVVRRAPDSSKDPWYAFISFFYVNRQVDYKLRNRASSDELIRLIYESRSLSFSHQAAVCLLVARVITSSDDFLDDFMPAWLNPESVKAAVQRAREIGRHTIHYISRTDDYLFWLFLTCVDLIADQEGGNKIIVKFGEFFYQAMQASSVDVIDEDGPNIGAEFVVEPQALYRRWGLKEKELERIRPYFASQEISRRIRPLEIQLIPASRANPRSGTTQASKQRSRRPILSLKGKPSPAD